MKPAPSRAPSSGCFRQHSHSSTAQPAEPAGALHPGLKAAVHALPAGGIELGVLDVKCDDALVIPVDEVEIVEALQHEMRRIVVDPAAGVITDPLQQHLERGAVERV